MSAYFKAVDRETIYLFLFPPSVQDWLGEKHLARFIADVVSKLASAVKYAKTPQPLKLKSDRLLNSWKIEIKLCKWSLHVFSKSRDISVVTHFQSKSAAISSTLQTWSATPACNERGNFWVGQKAVSFGDIEKE